MKLEKDVQGDGGSILLDKSLVFNLKMLGEIQN